jgi:hypothetical protein
MIEAPASGSNRIASADRAYARPSVTADRRR